MLLVWLVWLGLGLGLGLGLRLRLRVTLGLGLVLKLAFSSSYLRKSVEYRKVIRNIFSYFDNFSIYLLNSELSRIQSDARDHSAPNSQLNYLCSCPAARVK